MTKGDTTQEEFAVIETGGKQYRVSKGDTVRIEKITGEFAIGDKVIFDKVILVDNGTETSIGAPYIGGAQVEGTIKDIGRADKVVVVKYLQKSRYHKKNGHRQPYFEVTIGKIQ